MMESGLVGGCPNDNPSESRTEKLIIVEIKCSTCYNLKLFLLACDFFFR